MIDSGTVKDGYVPLSVRLYRKQQETERRLRGIVEKTPDNPLLILDPATWGEQNFYIEDRSDPITGRSLGPGLIILAPHQKTIIRQAVSRVLEPEQMFGSHADTPIRMRLDPHVDQHVVNMTLSPIYGGQKPTTPIYGGKMPKSSAAAAADEGYNTSSLYIHHHQQHQLFSTSVLFSPYGIGVSDSLTLNPLPQDNAALLLQLIITCTLTRTSDQILIPLEYAPQFAQSHPNYELIQSTLQRLVENTTPIAALHKLIVTSTRYRFSTIVYSCPKKSGKTRISAMMSSWLASHSPLYSEIYLLANDGKASQDRVLAAVIKGIELSKKDGKSEMSRWEHTKTRVELPEGQFMEAIPVDPEGEAGSQPTGTFWTELWGYGATIKAKEKLWTELTIPPTRWGHALRWVDSYAGFEGDSNVLWGLYLQGVDKEEHPQGNAARHPMFPDLPVYINERAGMMCYWDHKPRMAWQTPEYYASQFDTMAESEFRRVHRNEWVSPLEQAIPIDRWDQLSEGLEPVGKKEPIVLGVDLSVSGDYSALVVVSKHPRDKTRVAIRGVYVWEPGPGMKIDYSTTIMPAIRRWVRNKDGSMNYNVICVTYDEYQAHLMSIELTNELGVWWEQFSQGKGTPQHPGRPVADKMFFDLIMSGKLSHDGNVVLRQHVHNAAAKTTDEGRYMRFVKKREDAKIDALVAASMAVCMISTLNV